MACSGPAARCTRYLGKRRVLCNALRCILPRHPFQYSVPAERGWDVYTPGGILFNTRHTKYLSAVREGVRVGEVRVGAPELQPVGPDPRRNRLQRRPTRHALPAAPSPSGRAESVESNHRGRIQAEDERGGAGRVRGIQKTSVEERLDSSSSACCCPIDEELTIDGPIDEESIGPQRPCKRRRQLATQPIQGCQLGTQPQPQPRRVGYPACAGWAGLHWASTRRASTRRPTSGLAWDK